MRSFGIENHAFSKNVKNKLKSTTCIQKYKFNGQAVTYMCKILMEQTLTDWHYPKLVKLLSTIII